MFHKCLYFTRNKNNFKFQYVQVNDLNLYSSNKQLHVLET